MRLGLVFNGENYRGSQGLRIRPRCKDNLRHFPEVTHPWARIATRNAFSICLLLRLHDAIGLDAAGGFAEVLKNAK